jgi:cytochrome c553
MKHAVRAIVLGLSVVVPAGAVLAQAPAAIKPGASLAADMGCLNCHGTPHRGDAPDFRQLRERAASRGQERGGIAKHWIEEMRETGRGRHAIVAHRQVSDAAAQALTEWLTSVDSKPVN